MLILAVLRHDLAGRYLTEKFCPLERYGMLDLPTQDDMAVMGLADPERVIEEVGDHFGVFLLGIWTSPPI